MVAVKLKIRKLVPSPSGCVSGGRVQRRLTCGSANWVKETRPKWVHTVQWNKTRKKEEATTALYSPPEGVPVLLPSLNVDLASDLRGTSGVQPRAGAASSVSLFGGCSFLGRIEPTFHHAEPLWDCPHTNLGSQAHKSAQNHSYICSAPLDNPWPTQISS